MTQSTQRAGENGSYTNMIELVTDIARALVDFPENVSVETFDEEEATVIRLHVAPSDIGKVIGKQGRTARSMRTILAAASMKMKHRFSLDIVEDHSTPA
ncbi:MAG TPA: KH domain-containing protein [Edaphobacter sp.]|nr:KH domain-containing protein [Edaphobacter sp.]